MAGFYKAAPQGMNALVAELQEIKRRLSVLERPTATQLSSLVPQVQAALANIITTVNDAIEMNSYTKAQIDSKVASPGNITPGNVTASGQVQSNGAPFLSVPSHNYIVNKGNWVVGYIDSDGAVGTSPSSEAVKVDLEAMDEADAAKVIGLTPYWGRYLWDAADSPLKAFVLAEEVQAAGFGPDVAPVVTGHEAMNVSADPDRPVMIEPGQAWTVNYAQLVVPLLAAVKAQQTRIDALVSRLDAAGIS
jgi:hypothetical protein